MFFATCSVAEGVERLTCSTTAEVSGEPVMRNALVKARRRIASRVHRGAGCNHAPRPGRLPVASTITAQLPVPVDTATTRSSSTANSRFRQPTHVRTGPSLRRCAEAEVSRWITVESTVLATGGNHRRCTAGKPGCSAAARGGHRRRAGLDCPAAPPPHAAGIVAGLGSIARLLRRRTRRASSPG